MCHVCLFFVPFFLDNEELRETLYFFFEKSDGYERYKAEITGANRLEKLSILD